MGSYSLVNKSFDDVPLCSVIVKINGQSWM